jgi:thiamine pyrophosphate-dependent acetolactate synthase large subunit-like protein
MIGKLDAVGAVREVFGARDLVVCCNGMIGRELFTVQDRPSTFYMIGSMGLALSIGMGLAMAQPKRRIVVLDGDGNVLMGMNALASAGSQRPENLVHVVLDNQTHASTGGQRTISGQVHLENVALAVGYRSAKRVTTREELVKALREAGDSKGPTMVLVEVEGGTQKGIARVEPSPPELAARFAAEAQK